MNDFAVGWVFGDKSGGFVRLENKALVPWELTIVNAGRLGVALEEFGLANVRSDPTAPS